MSSEEGFKTSHTAMDIWSFYLLSQKICYLIHFLTISMSFFFLLTKLIWQLWTVGVYLQSSSVKLNY